MVARDKAVRNRGERGWIAASAFAFHRREAGRGGAALVGSIAVTRFLPFAALFACALSALAHAGPSVYLEDLTWTEVRDAVHGGKTTIIVPVGGTEQNGPHMVLGKHNVRVHVLAGRIAAALGNALVAPVVAYVPEGPVNPPTAHMRFPGTITVPVDAFEKVLESAARGCRLHGFKDVVFIGDHGGYGKSLREVAARLDREWAATSVRAHAIDEYYRAGDAEFAQLLRAKGYSQAEIGTHAGLADTSLALAIDPSLVREDRLGAPNRGPADGVHGDPKRASAELGRLGVDLVVDRTVAAIRKATARR
jgi:creatinine amidohydrolase/Fe(II)-dependent formamide hydrolase-like protein